MKHALSAVIIAIYALSFTSPASAVTCANGVYRAGCVGPNGAAAVRKPYAAHPRAHYRSARRPVTCVNGVYRAGCAGPNGAAVVRKPY